MIDGSKKHKCSLAFGLSYNIDSNFVFATSYTGCTGQKAGYGC